MLLCVDLLVRAYWSRSWLPMICRSFSDTEYQNFQLHVHLVLLLYIQLSNSFLIGRKPTVKFRNQRS